MSDSPGSDARLLPNSISKSANLTVPRVVRGAAAQAAIASGVNQTVRLPRARRPASYSAQLVTRCRCFGIWRRQVALALNGTAEIQASGKGPSSYTAQLPTPTGRSVQQGGPH